ncbi:MAG TPA: ParB N-terminal domain-containing protein [Bryobacteraceae bacterium]|nr:ParB N-terminal domain-containing protein [Bryobacteraceae bacterium]
MAVKLNVPGDMRRTDTFVLDPFDVIVDEQSRGRFIPPTDEQIEDMASSIYANGQIQPVECRRNHEQKPVLVLGFTRTAAVRLIKRGWTRRDGVHIHDPNIGLKVMIVEANEELSLLRNIEENKARNATSIIDDVHNWQKLADRYGKSDAEIAGIYGVSPSYVSRNRKLLRLGFETQLAVHRGEIPLTAALTLADEVPEASHKAVIEAVKAKSGEVTGVGVVKHLRELAAQSNKTNALPDAVLRDDPAKAPAAAKPAADFVPADKDRPVSMKEVRALVDKMKTDSVSALTKKIGVSFDRFLRGRSTLEDVMQDLFEIGGKE